MGQLFCLTFIAYNIKCKLTILWRFYYQQHDFHIITLMTNLNRLHQNHSGFHI